MSNDTKTTTLAETNPHSDKKTPEAKQKPSVGRVVIFHCKDHAEKKPDGYAAIITGVNKNGSVNLSIQNDASAPYVHTLFPVNVFHVDSPEGDGSDHYWSWPNRV